MTDQKQAPERDSVKWWIGERAPVDVAEAFDALAKQRDELVAENERLRVHAENGWHQYRHWVGRYEAASKERDQALAASAAREIAMRDRAAEVVRKHLGPNPFCQEEIRALPLSPDGRQALEDVRADAWIKGVDDLTTWLYKNTSDGGAVRYQDVLKLNPYRKESQDG